MSSGPIVPTWRDASPPPTPQAGPAWRATPPRTPYRPRWRRLGAVALLALGCLTALTYAALWLRPPEPARLVVLTAGYDTNLAVPPNPYGKAAARHLASLTRPPGGFFGTHRRLHGPTEPARLTRGHVASFLPDLDAVREKCVVVVVTAHGGRDRDGAFLFPDDATPDSAHRVRLKSIIARFRDLPPAKQKLLVLDATQPPAYPDLGLVHNDFAAALEDLEPDIAQVPNLVVLASTGPDQRSWASPEHGVTIFAHFLSEALTGAADADGDRRITGWEVAEYVRAKVHDWARDHRAALQDPVLLPRGSEGETRARTMHLAMTDGKPHPPAAAPAPFEPPAEVEQLWQEYRDLAAAYVPPTAYTPHLWREYEAWVLRYEQLVLAGDADAARLVRARAADVRQKIEAARTLDISPQTLALPCALGGVKYYPQVPPVFHEAIGRVAATPGPVERAKAWAEAQSAAAGIDPAAARLLWGRALVEWVAADPLPRLPAVPDVLPLVTEGMTVRPAELHFLYMLSKHHPRVAATTEYAALLRDVLTLRLHAEQESMCIPASGGYPYTSDISLGVGAYGDGERRRAEDLCFATDPTSWQRAGSLATEARTNYRVGVNKTRTGSASAVRRRGVIVATHAGYAKLPAYTEWLARGRVVADHPDRRTRDLELHGIIETWFDLLAEAVREDAEAPSRFASRLTAIDAELARQSNELVTAKPEFEGRPTPRADVVRWWHAADTVLTSPPPDRVSPARRRELLREFRRVSRQLVVTGQTRSDPLPEVSAGLTRERAFEAARRRGLFIIGYYRGYVRDRDDVEFLLNSFAIRADARVVLADIGGRIGESLLTDPDTGRPEVWPRVAPACAPTNDDPVLNDRRGYTAGWLEWQAHRTWGDNWYGEAPEAYYRTAIRQLRQDAARIHPEGAKADLGGFDGLIKSEVPFPVGSNLPQRLSVTDEPDPAFVLRLTANEKNDIDGYAVFCATPPFAPAGKSPVPRIVARTTAYIPPPPLAKPGDPPPIIPEHNEKPPAPVRVALARPAVPSATPAPVSKPLTVRGFFRGRVVTPSAPVDFYAVPDHAAVRVPPPPAATLAVRASPALHADYGLAGGSVAFVLDCSGSMRPNPTIPGHAGNYPEAVRVLERLLRGLPRGTTVGVWAFGQRTPDAKTPEDTIRELRPPAPFAGDATARAAVIEEVMAQVRGLEPWDKSPVARAVLRAKAGLAAAAGPFKAVVLVSDAEDNRFAEDAELARGGRSLADVLRTEFTAAGTSLGVVAFPPENPADAKLQAPFRVANEPSVGGRFVLVPKADEVLRWLKTGLNPRVRYTVEGTAAGADLDAGAAGADVWYSGRLPKGKYTLKLQGDLSASWKVELEEGDRLLLEIVDDRGRLGLQRVWSAATDPAIGRTGKGVVPEPDWKLAVRQARRLGPGAAELFAVLDDRPKAAAVITPTRVGDVWFDVAPATGGDKVGVRWRPGLGFPAPSWWLDLRGWPTLPGGTASPVVGVWWHPEGPFPATGTWRFPDGERVGVRDVPVKVGDATVTVNGVTVEDHLVEVTPWTLARKRCLVVRLTCPADSPYWVRPVGLAPAGSEVRVYGGANKVTCLFWAADRELDDAAVNGSLSGFEFVSQSAATRAAKAAGHYLRLDGIPGPTDTPPRVEPPVPAR